MNHAALDRALCERLGIEPEIQWVVGNSDSMCFSGTEGQCRNWYFDHTSYCVREGFEVTQWKRYPALSTTWAGMGRLMEVLQKQKHEFLIEYSNDRQIPIHARVSETGFQWSESAPLALALAAARALEIEVPE